LDGNHHGDDAVAELAIDLRKFFPGLLEVAGQFLSLGIHGAGVAAIDSEFVFQLGVDIGDLRLGVAHSGIGFQVAAALDRGTILGGLQLVPQRDLPPDPLPVGENAVVDRLPFALGILVLAPIKMLDGDIMPAAALCDSFKRFFHNSPF